MRTFTDYLWFTTRERQEFVRITDDVAAAVKKSGVKEGMVLVSANRRLRADAEARAAQDGIPVFVPPLSLSTDNAAMIGAAAMRITTLGAPRRDYEFNADPALML